MLARHPWPWRIVHSPGSPRAHTKTWWEVRDAKGACLFDDGSNEGTVIYSCDAETRDAILELVEAHVARNQAQSTHSEECWRWHHGCAVAKVEKLLAEEYWPEEDKE